ncbi:MAG: hypothetical protein ABI818_01345 [Acidobacteriota bacterium]
MIRRWPDAWSGLLLLSRRELTILVLVFAASLPAVTARLYSSDEVQYFSYLRSLWFDHDVSFENEYQYFYDHHIAQSADFHRTFLEMREPTGRRINYATMGCAVLWSPFYGAADVVARALRASGRDVATDGYSRLYVSAVAYGSAFYAFAAILLAIGAARRIIGTQALSSGLAVWAGTPLLFYMYIAPPFSHANSAFAVALFVTVWLRVRRTWSITGAIALGLSGALMAMVREQDLFFVAGPAVDFLIAFAFPPRPETTHRLPLARTGVAGTAAFALGYLPQLAAYNALNGRPFPSSLVARKMSWSAPHALQVLASPEHGFFFWTPLAVLSIAGLVVLSIRAPRAPRGTSDGGSNHARCVGTSGATALLDGDGRRIGGCLLLMAALQVYVSGAVESWTVAGAFGQRRFVALTILLVVGLAALQAAVVVRAGRIGLRIAIALCLWWNIAVMAEFGTLMMDRQRLEWRRNAYDAFITLPRTAPGLVYRYFTHRASFYATDKPR